MGALNITNLQPGPQQFLSPCHRLRSYGGSGISEFLAGVVQLDQSYMRMNQIYIRPYFFR